MKVAELRDALKTCLRQTAWTQQEIARVAGLRQPAISRFLSGKSINAESAMRLRDFLQLPGSPNEVLPLLSRLEALETRHVRLSEKVEMIATLVGEAAEAEIDRRRPRPRSQKRKNERS